MFTNNFPRFEKCCLYTKTMSISSPWYIYLVCLVLSITGVKIMIQVKIMETKLELKQGEMMEIKIFCLKDIYHSMIFLVLASILHMIVQLYT